MKIGGKILGNPNPLSLRQWISRTDQDFSSFIFKGNFYILNIGHPVSGLVKMGVKNFGWKGVKNNSAV